MPNLAKPKLRTSLANTSYKRRRWLSLALIILGLIGLFNALSEECIEFSRQGIVECQESEPFAYWTSFLAASSVVIGVFFVFLSSFSKQGATIHQQQEALLNDWASTFKQPENILQDARLPGIAKFLLILSAGFILFILFRFGAFRDLFRLFLFILVLFPFSLAITMLTQWLGEKVKINTQGIYRYRMLGGWQHWHWDEISAVKLEGDFFEKNYQIKIFRNHQRIIFTPATFHQNKSKFLSACQWILQQAMLNQTHIHLPPEGLEEWLDAVQK